MSFREVPQTHSSLKLLTEPLRHVLKQHLFPTIYFKPVDSQNGLKRKLEALKSI